MEDLVKRQNQTVLVIKGRPYSLVKFNEPKVGPVCPSCDLRHICSPSGNDHKLIDLCIFDPRDTGWFFVEDWQHLNERILNFVDLADENYLKSK